MRTDAGRQLVSVSTGKLKYFDYGWMQAGLSGFAYRLAHLVVPRPVAIFGLVLAFILA